MLKCGFFEHDITPPLGAQMPGYFDVRLATGIKEPLKAIAAVFSDEEGVKSVIVACDAIQVPPQINLAAREEMLDGISMPEIERLAGDVDLSGGEDKMSEQDRDRIDAERADEMNHRFEDVVLNERAEEKFL